jgi:alkylation response protein AidB-like acyl-CoA dehydrogenase
MNLDLSEEQRILRKSAKDFFTRESSELLIREMRKHETGHDLELWGKMADLGWLGVIIPEEYGGTGGTFMDLAVILETMGEACLTGPFFSTAVLGANAILLAGTEDQKKILLPQISEGRQVIALALSDPGNWNEYKKTKTLAKQNGSEYVIEGVKHFVENAQVADKIICAAQVEDKSGRKRGLTLFLVDADSPGVEIKPFRTLAYERYCEVVFHGLRLNENAVLGTVGNAGPALETILERAAVAKCAEMLGAAQVALDITVAYAKERVQFGRPIGSFQAVQHHLANMAVDVDSMRYLTYQAAWRISEGLPAATEAAMAKAYASEAAARVTRFSHQVHGAIAFCDEHNLHFYYRKVKAAALTFGDCEFHLEKVAQSLGL